MAEMEKHTQPVVSFNTCILKQDQNACNETFNNKDTSAFGNKSLRSGFLHLDDEDSFLNHSSLSAIHAGPQDDRLQELQRRNTLCLPHLQSSYPLELEDVTPTEKKFYNMQEETVRKRKASEVNQFSGQVRKVARPSLQSRPSFRPKPVTPVRRHGAITTTKTFKTPSSIRRLMKLPKKNKQN